MKKNRLILCLVIVSGLLLTITSGAINIEKISVENSNESADSTSALSSAPSTTPSILTQSSASSYELTCRAKAKELAAETYRNCVTENRNAEIERIRKDYHERLRSLKQDYEKDIERLNDKSTQKENKTKALRKIEPKIKTQNQIETQNSVPASYETAKSHIGRAVITDDSVMDLPEPIPVESIRR